MLVGCAARPVVIGAAGDLSLAGRWTASALPLDVGPEGEVRFVNLEGPLTTRGAESGLDGGGVPTGAPVRLRADPSRAGVLRGRFEVASIENNHAFDQGEVGLRDTERHLRAVGVAPLSRAGPVRLSRNGQRLVFLARWYEPTAPLVGEHELVAAVRAARREGQVIVSLHWGHTGSALPLPEQRDLAHDLVDAGASAVLGHGPHAIQGVEIFHGAVIAYSLGNLAFGCACTEERDSFTLRFVLAPDGKVSGVALHPLVAGIRESPRPSTEPGLLQLIETLSEDLGSRVRRAGDELLLEGR